MLCKLDFHRAQGGVVVVVSSGSSTVSDRSQWVDWVETVRHDWLQLAGTDGGVDASVIGFVGNRGGGKTVSMSEALYFTYRAHPFQRFVIADINRHFGGFYFKDGKPVQADFRSLPAGLCVVYQPNQIHLIRKYFARKPFHIVDMVGLSDLERAEVSRRLVAEVRRLSGCTLVLDELPRFSKDGKRETFKKAGGMVDGLSEIITEGRHLYGIYGKGVSLLWAVQSTKYIVKDVLDQSDRVFAHRIQRPTDARGVTQDWWGGAELIDLSKLNPPEFYLLKAGGLLERPKNDAERRKALTLKGLSVPLYRGGR